MILPGSFPPGAAVVGGASDLSAQFGFLAGATSNPHNTYNFSGAFGPEHATRRLCTIVYGQNANLAVDANYTTAVSHGGVAATRIYQPSGNMPSHHTVWLSPKLSEGGPTGESGAVAVTRSTGNGFLFAGAATFALYGNLLSASPFDIIPSVFGNPAAGSIDLDDFSVLLAYAYISGSGKPAFTWVGADKIADSLTHVSNSARHTTAFANVAAAEASRSVQADNNAGCTMFAVALA